ncbi:MAG: filamentous hemagglutinin N-terminal domain-containing protein [Campylobacterales bacterium]|nr:filamentous hemagglutinin N-terminal domain-containing protein [Campylobacterales bacterium]MBN2831975.1 filamentous hemagglutinin N-terminal domain-containing protein [Campylobacterales bacterium]
MNFRQIISISISLLLVSNQTLYAAGITVDTSATKAHQAELIKAPSGLPIVNIVTPNAQGLSHNKFSNFNVEQQGLILNNSKTVANTQLAGYISYNPNLTGNAAKLILSEVTGTSKTYLRGYTEVAGVAADVIIANPNGISVNGGGFINTPNVTLSTGTPMLHQGVLQGFDVSGGNIVIEGDGFNAHNIAKVNLYAKALELNAKLYADALHVTTGENTIALDGTVSSKEKTSTGLSLDSTLLGGIYANAITLKSSDKGIGVTLPPEVLAQDSLELDVNGEIIVSKVTAGATTLKAHDAGIKLQNNISAKTLSIDAGKKLMIEEDKIIEASDALSIITESILNQGELSALEGKDKSTLRVTQSLENEGFIGGYDMDVSATHIENTGAIYSKNALSINAQTLNNDGLIRSNSTLGLLVFNTLTNQKEGVIYSDDTMTLAANSAHDKSESITNYGLIQSEKNIAIHAKTLNNLASAPTLKDLSSSTSKTISRGGKNDFDIVTTSIYKTVVEIPSSPAQIMADGSMLLELGTLNNVYSLIASDEDIVLNATLANNIGVVLITNTKVVTTQYRDRKKCKRKHGVFKSCKHIADYRGSFTQSENVKEPIANYGIQAKKSITGNVVTLNNLSAHAGLIGNAEIQAKLAIIETIELNTKNLNALSNELTQNSEGTLDFIIDEESLDSLLEGVKTLEDLSTYQTELLATKSDIQEILDESKPLVNSLESLLPTLQTLDATANTAPITTTLETIKANFSSMETHLLALEELSSSLKVVDDAKLQKDALLLNQEALSTLINQNTTLLQNLDLSALNTSLESKSDTLRSEVGVALAQQSNVEYKIINANNGLYQTNTHHALSSTQAPTYTTNNSTIIDNITLPKGKYGTFLVNKTRNHPYLIEANPRYTNYNTFISSDYMLSKLNFKPEQTQKRLGDAMYETELVSNSIVRLSGSRYLEGYGTELAQFQGLMDNALSVQKDLGLELGISLSLEQIARLSKNIVWMVEKEIAGEKVLVPEVYLASSNVSSDGARIEAGEIHLLIEETLLNNSIITSEGSLKIATGASLTNQNGSIISGGIMALSSKGVLENLSGTIHSDGDMTLDAKSIHSTALSEEKTYTYARGYQRITEQGNAARFTSGGNLSMQTNDEISLVNSYIQATNDVTLTSKGTIALSALAKNETYDFKIGGGYNKGYATTHAPSSIEASNITLNASALTLNASNLTASDTLNLHATEGVAILASNDVRYQDTKVKTKGGLFGGKRVKKDEVSTSTVVSSTLSAKTLNIDTSTLSIQGSKLTAEQATIASEIIELISLKNSEYESHFSDKSGMMTRTIVSKGHVKEEVVPALIEVRDQLIINNKDVTQKLLQTDNLMKTITSQSGLSVEQIKLVEAYAKSDEWNKKMTTLSGVGSIIVAAVVTVCTMGAGAGVAAGMVQGMNMAASAATQAAIQSAIQSVVVQATSSLVTAAITGNSPELDTNAVIKGAVLAGVMSYTNTTLTTDALKENMGAYDYAKNATIRGTIQGVGSEISGGTFKDGFATGATLSVVSDGALQMRQYVKDNFDYAGKDGKPVPENVKSVGVNGDGVRLGGSHLDPEGFEVVAPTGGSQSGERLIFGTPYSEGGVIDKTVEYFAGPHDFLSSWNYENINIDGQTLTVLKDNGILVNVASGALLIPALPLAVAPFIQNNINEINTINSIQEQESKKAEDFINTIKREGVVNEGQ